MHYVFPNKLKAINRTLCWFIKKKKMANNNQLLNNVYNVSGDIPMVDPTTVGGEVHTSRLGVVIANAMSLQAVTTYGGTGIHQQGLPFLMIPFHTSNEKPEKFTSVDFLNSDRKRCSSILPQ